MLSFSIMLITACSNTTVKENPIEENEDQITEKNVPTETELSQLEVLETSSTENNPYVFFDNFNTFFDLFTTDVAKEQAIKMYNDNVKKLIDTKDYKKIHFLFSEGIKNNKDVLSKELATKVDKIVSNEAVKVENDSVNNKIKDMFSLIQNKDFNSLRKYRDFSQENEMINSVLYYGYAIEEIQKNGETDFLIELLSSIDPYYNGEKSTEIKSFVGKYLTPNEWIENYEKKKRLKKEMEEFSEEQAKKPLPTIGMTKDEVLESKWGKPFNINTTTTKYGVSEQWIYLDNKYLYFDDGVLTGIQE